MAVTPKKLTGKIMDGSHTGVAGVVQAQMKVLAFTTDGEVVPRSVLAIAAADGTYAFDPAAAVPNGLISNADMTPANSSWTITHVAGGVPYPPFAVVIPNTAGPFAVSDPGIVVSSPALPAQYVTGPTGPTGATGATGPAVTTWPATGITGLATGQVAIGTAGAPVARALVVGDVAGAAPLASPTFTGDPWYDPTHPAYGAKGDGRIIQDGVMNGANAVLTSASNPFVAGDVGKLCLVPGAGVAGALLTTTVASYQNAGQVTLASASATAVAAATVTWGTDDTAALQACITALPTGATMFLPYRFFLITAPLSVTKTLHIATAGFTELFGSGSPGTGLELPSVAPFIVGSAIIPCTAGQNGINLTGTAAALHLDKVAIRFADGIAFVNTGHGINAIAAATIGPGHDSGTFMSRWDNVCVFGHDGNHYAYYLMNPAYVTGTHVRGYGGGGLFLEVDSYVSPYGNSVFIAPYFMVICGGTANGYTMKSRVATAFATGSLILCSFTRPQVNMTSTVPAEYAGRGIPAVTGAQYLWRNINTPHGIAVDDPDFETNVANGIDFGGYGNGTVVRNAGVMNNGPTGGMDTVAGPATITGTVANQATLSLRGVDGATSYIGASLTAGISGYGSFIQLADGIVYNLAIGADPSSGDFAIYDGRYPGVAGVKRLNVARTTGTITMPSGDLLVQSGHLAVSGGVPSTITQTSPGLALVITSRDSNASGMQLLTAADAYPLLHTMTYGHDNLGLLFDSFYDGSWKSSNLAGNFRLYKTGGAFTLDFASGVAAGSVLSWSNALKVSAAGALQVGVRPAFAAGDKYVVMDASGNLHLSALGPAS